MDCNFCFSSEKSKGTDGKIHQSKPDKNVTKMACGNCVQKLLAMKIATRPWEGNLNQESNNDKPVLRRRRH